MNRVSTGTAMFTTFGKDVKLSDLIGALKFLQDEFDSVGGADPYLAQYSLEYAAFDGDSTLEECVRLTFVPESMPDEPEAREGAE
jgi:hypothetical protein